MYQFSYNEILEDSGAESRRHEREAFDRVIGLLAIAQEKGPGSIQAVEAIYALRQLWTVLMEDLASPDNALPDDLRANLISIGIWMLKEAAAVGADRATGFDAMIAINTMIRDGLK
jgi:flagellar protein FlaF